jgi:hypothetical protein
MKTLYRTTLVAALFAATLSSCEKKSVELEKLSDKKTGIISEKVFPLTIPV